MEKNERQTSLASGKEKEATACGKRELVYHINLFPHISLNKCLLQTTTVESDAVGVEDELHSFRFFLKLSLKIILIMIPSEGIKPLLCCLPCSAYNTKTPPLKESNFSANAQGSKIDFHSENKCCSWFK